MGKLIEWLVHRRLTLLLEPHQILSEDLPDFNCGRGTADPFGDLTSALEEARAKRQTTHIMSLDVCHAFDFIHHSVLLE